MATIQEENLPKQLSDITGADFIRIVLAGGGSKDIQKQLLTWAMSQIDGLVDELAAKASKEDTAALKGFLAYVKSDGDLGGSGYSLSDLTALTIDNIKNGIALASTPFDINGVGTVYGVMAVGNIPIGENATGAIPTASVQLIMSNNGIFYRIFNVTWGGYSYVGGSFDVRGYARADLIALMNDDKLTPGTQYMIIDHLGDAGIIVTAATSDSLFQDGIRLTYVPAYSGVGSYLGNTWLGEWTIHLSSASSGNLCTFMGKVFSNIHGYVGTADGWNLDAVEWEFVDYTVPNIYNIEVHKVRYDIRNDNSSTEGWISKESDNRGNEFGIEYDDLSGFRTEFCQWGTPYVYGNKLKSVRNCVVTDVYTIFNNNGQGDVYGNKNCKIYECVLTDDNNNIRDNINYVIYKNTIIGTADIDRNTSTVGSYIQHNTIGGDIKDNTDVDVTNTEVDYNGKVKDCTELVVSDSKVFGLYEDNARINFSKSILKQGASYRNKGSLTARTISNSVLDSINESSETIAADVYVREDLKPLLDDIIEGGSLAKKFKNWFTKILTTYTIDSLLEDLLIKTGAGKTLKLDTPVYKDVNTAISSGRTGAVNQPTWVAFSTNLGAYTFAIDDYIDLATIEYPHECVVGGTVEAHLHVTTNGTDTTNRYLKFRLFYAYGLPNNGAHQFTAESYFDAEVMIPANTPDKSLYMLHMGNIVDANMYPGAQIKFRIKRIAASSTAPTNNPYLGQVGTHCLVDTMGSRSISAK